MTETAVASMDPEELLDVFRNMTLAELTVFRQGFEKAFGVSAAPLLTPAEPALPPAEEPEEPTEFTVTLEAPGPGKIQVIKEIRLIMKLGLKEAKDFVDGAPKVVLEGVPKDVATKAMEQLQLVGGVVTMAATV